VRERKKKTEREREREEERIREEKVREITRDRETEKKKRDRERMNQRTGLQFRRTHQVRGYDVRMQCCSVLQRMRQFVDYLPRGHGLVTLDEYIGFVDTMSECECDVAECCSVLQCVAMCCSVLQCVAVCCIECVSS